MIIGVCTELYRRARERLESRNRELQQVIEQETARRERQEQELEQAREIQQSLMPKEIPQVAGFEIDGAWEPARVVGGDYFDVIRLSEAKLGICIADVVGKSVSAALLMTVRSGPNVKELRFKRRVKANLLTGSLAPVDRSLRRNGYSE